MSDFSFVQTGGYVDEIPIEQVSKLTGLAIISIEVRLRRGTFPKPVRRMKRTRYWDRKEVLGWLKEYRARKAKRACKSYTTLQWSKDREALDRCEFGTPYLALTDNGAYDLRRTEPEADTDDVVAWAELPDEEALARQLWMSWIKGDKE